MRRDRVETQCAGEVPTRFLAAVSGRSTNTGVLHSCGPLLNSVGTAEFLENARLRSQCGAG